MKFAFIIGFKFKMTRLNTHHSRARTEEKNVEHEFTTIILSKLIDLYYKRNYRNIFLPTLNVLSRPGSFTNLALPQLMRI